MDVLCDVSQVEIDFARHPFHLEYVFEYPFTEALTR
jgi:hypothetical protein